MKRQHLAALVAALACGQLAVAADNPDPAVAGKSFFRQQCGLCHSAEPNDNGGAQGPSLQGIFGRKAGAAPGYNYSEAFRKLEIVWTRETVSRLFEIGPQAYTPGTKMPEPTVNDPEARAALMDFLEAATSR